jgi:hypothetical protein
MFYRVIVGASAGLLLAVTSVAITSAGSSHEAGAPAPASGGSSSAGGGGASASEHGGGGAFFGRGGEEHSIGLGGGWSFGGGGLRSSEGTGSRGASSTGSGEAIIHGRGSGRALVGRTSADKATTATGVSLRGGPSDAPPIGGFAKKQDVAHAGKPNLGLHPPRISPADVGHGASDAGDRVPHSNGEPPGGRSGPPVKSIRQNARVYQQALAGSEHRFVRRHFHGRVEEHNRLLARHGRRDGATGWVGGTFWLDAFYDWLGYAFGPYDADYLGDQRLGADEAGAQACGREAAGTLDFPFDSIQRTLQPSADQQAKLEDLKIAAHRAASALKASCRVPVEPTAVGRLDMVARRLTAMLNAVKTVRGPLAALYGSLSEEQRARFDHMRIPGSRTAASLAGPAAGCHQAPAEAVKSPAHELDTSCFRTR